MTTKILTTILALIACSTMVFAQEKTPEDKNIPSQTKTEQQQDSVYYSCTMHPDITMDRPGKCNQCNMPLEKKTTSMTKMKSPKMEGTKTYTCAAHPEVKSDKPGKCSQCGMELIIEEKIK